MPVTQNCDCPKAVLGKVFAGFSQFNLGLEPEAEVISIRSKLRKSRVKESPLKMNFKIAPNSGRRLWTGCTPLKTGQIELRIFD
ncbi:MAG: hypothetical protein WCC87_01855 [Candidatus Korobacteraceae bacterium]